jgi:hypothetical protein
MSILADPGFLAIILLVIVGFIIYVLDPPHLPLDRDKF